jgi:hypothetical protein
MADTAHGIAVCCYNDRAVVLNRCGVCKAEYACPEFKTKAALVQFNAMIPASMLLSPLPIEIWPSMCADVAPDVPSQPSQRAVDEPPESPVRRLVSALGLPINLDPQST